MLSLHEFKIICKKIHLYGMHNRGGGGGGVRTYETVYQYNKKTAWGGMGHKDNEFWRPLEKGSVG